MKKYLYFLFGVMLFTGCTPSYYTSINDVDNNKNRDKIIVKDILRFVRGYYSPAKTEFYINTKFNISTTKFSNKLEERFRKVGYGISHNETDNSIPFAFKIDKISSSLIRATFNISNANISRIYKKRGSRYRAISPFTVRGLSPYPRYRSRGTPRRSSRGSLLARIISSTLNVRSRPSISSKILRTYRKGTLLRIAYKTRNKHTKRYWSKLKNFKGFVASEHLEMVRR